MWSVVCEFIELDSSERLPKQDEEKKEENQNYDFLSQSLTLAFYIIKKIIN